MASLDKRSILVPLALAAALPLAACEYWGGPGIVLRPQEVGEHRGPPPQAPAYGYRRKQPVENGRDLELEFDSGLGVYAVVGIPDVYFLAGHYFRFSDDGWQISVHHDSGWTIAAKSDVPSGLWESKPGNGKRIPPGLAKKGWGGPPGPAKHGAQDDDD